MSFIDFLFSYKTIIKSHLLKKKYFQAFRKSINFPYKFLLNQMRIYFKIRKTNLDGAYLCSVLSYLLSAGINFENLAMPPRGVMVCLSLNCNRLRTMPISEMTKVSDQHPVIWVWLI